MKVGPSSVSASGIHLRQQKTGAELDQWKPNRAGRFLTIEKGRGPKARRSRLHNSSDRRHHRSSEPQRNCLLRPCRRADGIGTFGDVKAKTRPSNLFRKVSKTQSNWRNIAISEISGGPDAIRTRDLCLRRATLYPAELQVHAPSDNCFGDRLPALFFESSVVRTYGWQKVTEKSASGRWPAMRWQRYHRLMAGSGRGLLTMRRHPVPPPGGPG